jgi:hypothetical protein
MNTAITIRFLTPYVSSITRDQDFVHSPLPLDGAVAHAAYWEALVAGRVADLPTGGRADPALMRDHVTPVLDAVFGQVSLGDLLGDSTITEQVYAVSSGFPLVKDRLYVKRGARWLDPDSGDPLTLDYEVQPIRKRVPLDRLSSLGLTLVGERGGSLTREPETGKGVLKAIDNRVTTWRVYEYVWLAEVRDPDRLKALLEILKYQGMGKKRTAGFGKILGDPEIKNLEECFPSLKLRIKQRLFLDDQGQHILLRPLPYDAIMLAPGRVVMTNLMVESGCGYRPPYWSDRRVIVREGTIFRFLN